MQLTEYKDMKPSYLKIMADQFSGEFGFNIKEIGLFAILYPGWECDSDGFIIIGTDNVRHLMMSNHGRWYEAQAEDLIERLDYYKSIVEETTQVLNILEG